MKIKFQNAVIIKDFDSQPLLGELVVDNDKIVFVGEKCDLECDKIIDAKHNILMPGFVDTHSHSAMTLLRGLSGGKKLENWLSDILTMERKMTGNDVYYGTLLANLEYAKNGITSVNDNYYFPDYQKKAYLDAGIRAVVSVWERYSPTKYLKESEMEKLYQKLTLDNTLITSNFFCHSVYLTNEKTFGICEKFAKKYNTFISTHVSETLDEVGKCASQNNDMSPVELLESYGFFDHKSLAIHATNVDEKDIQIFAKYGADISANFGSNYKLASGVCPIYQMQKYGINISLGTDGSASNNRLDMFREMYLALTSQNILLSNAKCLLSSDVLKMATINGAKALNLKNIGKLCEGYFADIIMLDTNGVDGAINKSIFDNIVFSYGTEDVLMTMVNGKIIYENGKYFFKKTKKLILSKAKELSKKFIV